ncbi:hypothetical protein [Comamonas sp. 23]|uniref:hypothetical protein n=1 Tax=Comamonas sp. 23 TaxID=3415008 RepID=UPI003C6F7545
MDIDRIKYRANKARLWATKIVTLEVGLSVGVSRLLHNLQLLELNHDEKFRVLGDFLNKIPVDTPLGDLRLLCDEKFLKSSDYELMKIELEFRQLIMISCLEIIREMDSIMHR